VGKADLREAIALETIGVVEDAWDCDGAVGPEGWFAAAAVIDDLDAEYLAELGRLGVCFRNGKRRSDWAEAMSRAGRKLLLLAESRGQVERRVLAEAERIHGPAVAGGGPPAVAWSQRDEGKWRLKLFSAGQLGTILESRTMLRAPAVARFGEHPLVACEIGAAGAEVGVWDDSGTKLLAIEGRRPKLSASQDGRGLLIVERASHGKIRLVAYRLAPGVEPAEIPLPPADGLNLNAHLVCDAADGTVYVVWESSPRWGVDERVGLHRDLSLWALRPGAERFQPGPGTCNGFLRVRPVAFADWSTQNIKPIRPRVVLLPGGPAVAFRRFRLRGFKGHGWDVFLTRWDGSIWTEPSRVSQAFGQADAGYSLVRTGPDVVGFFPCCDQRPQTTLAEEAAGRPFSGRSWYAENHRLEICRFRPAEALPDVEIPGWKLGEYAIPPAAPEPAPAPPELEHPPERMTLIWGDLHAHSAYSKCMSADDGMPEEVVRFQREGLGCRVLCLTEHVEYMTYPEFTHVLDAVEAEAGDDCVPLYAVEWGKKPAHHTNFYAIDRGVFCRLRGILLACDHLTGVYERIKRELPAGSVVAIRHFHGMDADEFGTSGPRVTDTHDPELEPAMEAMQTRGNKMIADEQFPLFPSNFLNAGARVGLVGGSDHSRGKGPNHFCLTGFWVAGVGSEAVLDAIRNRRTIASANGKVAIHATLAGELMGGCVSVSGPLRVRADVASAGTIRRVGLMRDGEMLAWTDLAERSASLELVDRAATAGRHWYAVTAEADSTLREPPVLAHASPFFVEQR